jgi:hypothetical protein
VFYNALRDDRATKESMVLDAANRFCEIAIGDRGVVAGISLCLGVAAGLSERSAAGIFLRMRAWGLDADGAAEFGDREGCGYFCEQQQRAVLQAGLHLRNQRVRNVVFWIWFRWVWKKQTGGNANGSGASADVSFVNIHAAAGPIDGAWEMKRLIAVGVVQGRGSVGQIWVVNCKLDSVGVAFGGENHQGVIDGELREADDVDDWKKMEARGEAFGFARLAAAGKRKEHSPMFAVHVGMPDGAAVLFEESLVSLAEVAQAGESGKFDALAFGAFFPRRATDHFADARGVF